VKKNIKTRAFTIIELLLVLLILSIILTIAIPSWHKMMRKNRALAYIDRLQAAIRFTRSAAILLGEPVTFCGSSNHQDCDGLWHEGSIVITSSGKMLRSLPKIYPGDSLSWRSSLGKNKKFTFRPDGMLAEAKRGSFFYTPKNDPAHTITIVILPTGRTRVTIKNMAAKN
jgi:prepilin-type N-terminal cleavage/methylation domain-containing protein